MNPNAKPFIPSFLLPQTPVPENGKDDGANESPLASPLPPPLNLEGVGSDGETTTPEETPPATPLTTPRNEYGLPLATPSLPQPVALWNEGSGDIPNAGSEENNEPLCSQHPGPVASLEEQEGGDHGEGPDGAEVAPPKKVWVLPPPILPTPELGSCGIVSAHALPAEIRKEAMAMVSAIALAIFSEDEYVTKAHSASKKSWQLELVLHTDYVAAVEAGTTPSLPLDVLGFILFRLGGETSSKELVGISKLWVRDDIRRRGLGCKLVKNVVAFARSAKAQYVTLWAYDAAVRFYSALGFQLGVNPGDAPPRGIAADAFSNEVSHYMEKRVRKPRRKKKKKK